ncbi:MAG: hypothetical protein HFF98_11330 [Oscillibacter sp.]|jgi:hypothetical protein|nr:hypothetical protein [Oscillibacter sp.]
MDNPVFDAMLKTALEEALRRDIREAPEIPGPSRRQRRRMRRLLAEPRRAGEAAREPETTRRSRNPARWLAAAVIAALLTGAAAGLGSEGWFRQLYEESFWAREYGDAADTDQLLGMGVETGTAPVEADGLRIEILDAVFDGQIALFAIRVTVLDQALLERLQGEDGSLSLGYTWGRSENGDFFGTFSFSPLEEDGMAEGQYLAEFSVFNEALSSAGLCRIQIEDLVLFPPEGGRGEVLRKGPWVLSAAMRPTEVLRLEPGRVCRVDGEDWVLDSLTLTPLALRLTMHRLEEPSPETENGYFFPDLAFHMKDGSTVTPSRYSRSTSDGGGTRQLDIRFPMPLDLTQVEYLQISGEDIYLEE